jgi:hypothetical protein
VDGLHLGAGASAGIGVVWAVAVLALLGAGLGLFGVSGLRGLWQSLALAGGGIGLAAVALSFHPWYLVALLVNLAILVTRAGTERFPFMAAGA